MSKLNLVSARLVQGGKISMTFSQEVNLPGKPQNLPGILNASDERFNRPKPQYAYLTGEPSDSAKFFGIDALMNATAEGIEINQEVQGPNGEVLNIQITETTEPTAWQLENFEKAVKRAGKDGEILKTEDGKFIYRNLTIVVGEPTHTLLKYVKEEKASIEDLMSEM